MQCCQAPLINCVEISRTRRVSRMWVSCVMACCRWMIELTSYDIILSSSYGRTNWLVASTPPGIREGEPLLTPIDCTDTGWSRSARARTSREGAVFHGKIEIARKLFTPFLNASSNLLPNFSNRSRGNRGGVSRELTWKERKGIDSVEPTGLGACSSL